MARAVISVKTKQYWVEQGSKIHCDRMEGNEGDSVELPVLGFFEDFKSQGKVKATIVRHYLGEKRVVFYKSKRGHDRHRTGSRPRLTLLRIDEVKQEGK